MSDENRNDLDRIDEPGVSSSGTQVVNEVNNGYGSACQPCVSEVNTCCFVQVPAPFNGRLEADSEQLVYDERNLSCVVRECMVNIEDNLDCNPLGQVEVYQIVIVGSIPYMVSQRLNTNACGRNVNIGCQGSVAVDAPICIKTNMDEALYICSMFNERFRNRGCGTLPNVDIVTDFVTNVGTSNTPVCPDNPDMQLVRFQIAFTLPGCPIPALPVSAK